LNAYLDTTHVDLARLQDGGRIGRVARANGGGFRRSSTRAAALHTAFGDRPDTIFMRGWGAEVMSGFYNLWPTRMRELTPAEMARLFFAPKGATPPSGTREFFEEYFIRGNYDGLDAFGYDPNDIFYWEHRMGMWGALSHNELDVAFGSLVCFNSRRLYETALGLPAEVRLTKRLLLGYIEGHDPALAAIPIDRPAPEPVARPARPLKKPQTTLAGAGGKLRRALRRLRSALT
jgi:hypothetical protein